MNKSVKNTLVLVIICAVMATLIAVTNAITAPIIKEKQEAATAGALAIVLPEGKDFEKLTLDGKYPKDVTAAYKAGNGAGFVFEMNVTGKSAGLITLCGVNAEGKVVSTKVVSDQETDAYDVKVFPNVEGEGGKYTDMGLEDFSEFIVSGATLTSKAYANAVKAALQAFVIANGGDVDLRTEEEILLDNLAAALPSANREFTKVFILEKISGVDAIYAANNGTGYVAVIGEAFVATDSTGVVVGEVDATLSATVQAAVQTIVASTSTEVDLTDEAVKTALGKLLSNMLISVKVTASGNYDVTIKGAGYGINGGDEYHPASGKYIIIRVAVSADGEILDCLTVEQYESENIGDACAKPEFYEQFIGKNNSNYGNITAIGGATITTDGYKTAIARAFQAINILKGGA